MIDEEKVIVIDENESTDHLSWYQISKAKDGEYETDPRVAEAIFKVLEPTLSKAHLIIDPTAGTGRLLKPFKKAGSQVLGIEFKESLANKLKHNLTKKYSRTGNILDYFNKLSYRQFDVAVCNPPYGLPMDIQNIRGLYSSNNEELVESQTVLVEMLPRFLCNNGVAVLIIPTSTWTNKKDKKLLNLMFDNFLVEHVVTLQKGFKKEYNIDILTDIIFLRRNHNISWRNKQNISSTFERSVISIDNIDKLNELVKIDLYSPVHESIEKAEIFLSNIPRLDTLSTFNQSENKLYIKAKGITGNESILSLLDFYDATNLEHYSSVIGNPASIKDCYFTIPSLIKNGVEPTINLCDKLNIIIEFNESDKNKFAKLKLKWDFESTPLYKPKSHELLAYYLYGRYKTKSDLIIDGKLIFNKDKEYLIKPTWVREKTEVERTELENAKGVKTGEIETKSLDHGYLNLEVSSNEGIREYPENDAEKIAEFLEVFELPDVKGLSELYPERVENWANILAKDYSYLFDWQAEDVARILCKRNPYIGFEMGGGKTVSAFAYASARKYLRTLIICQGNLIENWINEANKFGFKITAIRTHSDIWKLKQRIKNKDFKRHTSEFFVVGQEFLSLDGGRVYNQWTCSRKNSDGILIHNEITTKGKCSQGHKYEVMHKTCPALGCGADYSEGWTGRYCNKCGYRPFSYGKTVDDVGMRQYPAYKHMMKLFSCVITDESQNFAKRSLRGEATRTFKSKSKVMLTGTIMKNYVEDVFLNFGWLLGYNNPVYYFKRSDTRKFLDEFGSYEIITKSYLSEMKNASYRKRQGGRKKLLPAVSNLNRFWRMISPFTVRRLSEDVAELKIINRKRDYHFLEMDPEHFNLYLDYEDWAKKIIERELRKPEQEVNLGIISNCLWKLRFVANCPTNPHILTNQHTSEYPNRILDVESWNKPNEILKMVQQYKLAGDKTIVFSGLRFMQSFMTTFLRQNGIRVKYIGSSTQTKHRFSEITEFESNGYDVLVTGNNVLNRGYSITGANNVIFCDYEYTPEITDQAEFRVIRPGQEKDVNIHYMISSDTIDEQMKETCDQKRKAIKSAIDKKTDYASINELLIQADYRNPELKIARDIHNKVTIKKKKLVQPKPEIIIPLPVTNNIYEQIVEVKKAVAIPKKTKKKINSLQFEFEF